MTTESELKVLKNSTEYIVTDLKNYIMENYYKPSKAKAIEEITELINLADEEPPMYFDTNKFHTTGSGLVPKAYELIMKFEGFQSMPYTDSFNKDDPSKYIAYGQAITRVENGWKTNFGYFFANETLPMTKSLGLELLQTKMTLIANQLKANLKKNMRTDKTLNDNQFSALCCLAYNIGTPRLLSYKLMQYIYAGDFSRAANEFLDITNGGRGNLPNRRKAEVELFNS